MKEIVAELREMLNAVYSLLPGKYQRQLEDAGEVISEIERWVEEQNQTPNFREVLRYLTLYGLLCNLEREIGKIRLMVEGERQCEKKDEIREILQLMEGKIGWLMVGVAAYFCKEE